MVEKRELDRIYIRDLYLRCILGINDDERREKQDIRINIVIFADMRIPCQTDNIEDAVNYKTVKKEVIRLVENSSCFLVEKLADEIANTCLAHKKVEKVKVTVDKPGALRFAKSVAIEIIRCKEQNGL